MKPWGGYSPSILCTVLQAHYRYLEAIALQQESVEPITDLTNPDKEMIRKRAGKLLEDFKSLVYPEDYDPNKAGKKRKVCANKNFILTSG